MGLEIKLKNLLVRTLFLGNPSQMLCDGMTFCDMSMMRLIEVLKIEDPSLA